MCKSSNVYLNGTIKGRSVSFLLDTGSDYSLASYDCVKKHKCKLRKSDVKVIKAANGSDIIIEGETTIPLHVDGRKVNTVVLVSKDLSETILGIDWLQDHECEWDFVKRRIRFMNGNWVDLANRPFETCRRVYVESDVVIQPREERMIPARATLISIRQKPPISMIETHRLKPGIHIGRTLIPPEHDKAQVCLLNTTMEPQLITKGTCLGNLQPARLLDIVDQQETMLKVPEEPEKSEGPEGPELTEEPEKPEKPEGPESAITKLMGQLPDDITDEQRQTVQQLLMSYEDIFSKDEYDVGRTDLIEYHIDTGNNRPIRQPLRRQPLKHLDEIDKNVEAMQQHGIIEPAASPWASNVVVVTKKDGSLRFCVDYRQINNVTYKDSYPLPHIDNCLNAMTGSTWFSTLDLRAGYHNIPVAREDRDKTAFVTRRGCWRYTVMPFGLTCAPSVFQRLMDLVLHGLAYETFLVYLDDIIIFGRSFDEHLQRLATIFERLRKAKLKLKQSK